MQTEEADGNSLRSTLFSPSYTDSVSRQGENHVMAGFPVPSAIGEAMNISVHGQMGIHANLASSDEFWNGQLEKNAMRDFSIGNTCDSDQFMNGVPLSGSSVNALSAAKYWAIENQVKLTTSETFAYPCEYAKTAIVNNSSAAANSSFEIMNQGFNEGIAFDTNTQWGINNFMNPPELLRRITARTGNYDHGEWIMTERGALHSNSPGSSRFSNELSLSLSTSQRSAVNGTSIQEQCSELSSSGYSLHKRQSEHASCSSSNLSLSFNSHKPVQFSPLLSGSRFFHAMQEILAEIACYAMENFNQTSFSATGINNGVNLSFSPSDFSDGPDGDKRIVFQNSFMQDREVEARKKHLLELLQMVDDQYNQCLDEIHTVISAFHAVTELDPNLHARFALPAISFMYKNLRERISSHILAMGTATSNDADERDENSFENTFIRKQWALQQLRKRDHQLWRPQRGLPERSVSVLRAWMFQNFLHPYPKDAEKHLLALKSGLTRSQVSNWFINARVRLWKPMIEEMYAEMNRRKVRGKDDENDATSTQRNLMRFENRRFTMD